MSNSKEPLVSVLIPVYNPNESYLRSALESILNQTYQNFELLIVDDSKDDIVQKIIETYDDSRIKYIKGDNKKIAGALNKGLELAKGKYIARMDADDISMPERFEKQVKFLEENPDISIVGTSFKMFPKNQIFEHPENPKYLDILKSCCIGHPTVMLRKEDFEKYELKYSTQYLCEDYELWSRAARYLKFANIPQILLRYRWDGNNASNVPEVAESTKEIQKNMLDFLTDDEQTQQNIVQLLNPKIKIKYSFFEKIFSIKDDRNHRALTILGLKLKLKKHENVSIVRLMGGLGNQMFQYAFGRALEKATGQKVIYDYSWFEESRKLITNKKGESASGVAMRNYALDIFYNLDITFATSKQLKKAKKIVETKEFEFDPGLFKKRKNVIYEGYFQNEGYLENIKEEIKNDFKFPEIPQADSFNQNWLKKIQMCENPVFIHLRRGDYCNLGWNLSVDYYKKAIEYVKENVKNPTFFVFGQDCEDYIKKEFNFDTSFEIVGEENSKNKQDWKDIVLMLQCKHAIIANSSFSWWAAWLGGGDCSTLICAPSPFVNGKDRIICKNWVKIKGN